MFSKILEKIKFVSSSYILSIDFCKPNIRLDLEIKKIARNYTAILDLIDKQCIK